jgi:hypothetical protein
MYDFFWFHHAEGTAWSESGISVELPPWPVGAKEMLVQANVQRSVSLWAWKNIKPADRGRVIAETFTRIFVVGPDQSSHVLNSDMPRLSVEASPSTDFSRSEEVLVQARIQYAGSPVYLYVLTTAQVRALDPSSSTSWDLKNHDGAGAMVTSTLTRLRLSH